MGGKKVIIRDVYIVPALRLPLFSLRLHRRIPSCGYHSDNKGAVIFFPTFSLEVDDDVDNSVTCRSLGRKAETFDYIQPRASTKSAAAGSAPRRSARLNPPPSKDGLAWTPVRSPPASLPRPAPRRSTRLKPKTVRFAPPPSPDAGGAGPAPSAPLSPPRSSPPVSVMPSSDPSNTIESLNESTESEFSEDKVDPPVPLRGRPKLQTARINQAALLAFCRNVATPPPDIRCCDTPNGSDSLQDLTSDKIYHLRITK